MQINNNLLSQTITKSRTFAGNDIEENNSVNTLSEADININEDTITLNACSTNNNIVAGSIKQALYTDIKAAIYNYSHPTTNVTSSYGNSFDSICTTLGIGPNSTITKSALNKLTRNDSAEDSNNDFFGALNRAFSYLGPNDTISYNDLMLFFMRGIGATRSDNTLDFGEYKRVVETYSDIVQQQYKSCSTPQAKLEFVIDKTRDYLQESGMTIQENALDRLLSLDSENNAAKYNQIAHKGQIALAELGGRESDGSYTGGQYTTTAGLTEPSTYTQNGKEYSVTMWAGDSDYILDQTQDGGITLNASVLINEGADNHPWYELVEILVHELTHASAYFYYNINIDWDTQNVRRYQYSQEGLNFMISKGIIAAGEYNINDTDDARLAYLVNTMWGEYAAYITSCEYIDSLAGDIFDANPYNSFDLHTDGANEKANIYTHIDQMGYNTPYYEAEPDSNKWEAYRNLFYDA